MSSDDQTCWNLGMISVDRFGGDNIAGCTLAVVEINCGHLETIGGVVAQTVDEEKVVRGLRDEMETLAICAKVDVIIKETDRGDWLPVNVY